MSRIRKVADGWSAIVRSTWRAYAVFCGAGVIAVLLRFRGGVYAEASNREVMEEIGVAAILMFVAAFVTALVFHYQLRRNSRWPGGGGRRNR